MFREPEVVEPKAVGKLDPTAPARSSIRRQRSVRYPTRNARDRRPPSGSRSHRHFEQLLQEIRDPERARAVAARTRADRALNIEASANRAHAEASRRRRLDSGRATLRDALSYEHPHQPMSMRRDHSYALSMMRPPLPAATSPMDPSRRPQRRTLPWVHDHEEGNHRPRSPPPAYIPSPPYTSGDRSNRSSPDTLHSATAGASLTPRFAPAHSLSGLGPVAAQDQLPYYRSIHEDVTTDDSMMNEAPPLRRVSRRHPARQPQVAPPESTGYNAINGLGDRWRSISPDDDSWDTLLATMPPDERLPSSASTSFRSNNEDLAYYESLANSTEPITDTMEMYPVNCENTDSDFSETDDDTLFHAAENHHDSLSTTAVDQRHISGGSTTRVPRLRQMLSERASRQARDELRHERNRALLPDRLRSAGRSSWERL